MARNDWVPGREQDFVDLCEKWKTGLSDSAKIAGFGWDQGEASGVLGKITAFLTARTDYAGDNSSVKRLAKDEAKEEAVDAMRDFANSSIRFNKKMDDPQKLVFGIHPKDSSPTVHGKPESQPDLTVENTVNHFEHQVRAQNRETGDGTKPPDAYGVRYAWQVGGERPASGADLPKTKFSRKTSLVIAHTEGDKSKTCYYAACYESSRGEPGSWSPVVEAVIG